MPRVILSTSLVLLMAVPVAAAEQQADGPAGEIESPLISQEGELPGWTPIPSPVEMTGCTASLNCQDGNVVQCSGSIQCYVNAYSWSVKCDGVETPCPNRCQANRGCKCGTITCWSPSGNCSSGCCPGFIDCDGSVLTCTEACS